MSALEIETLNRFLTTSLSGRDFHLEKIKTSGTNQHFCVRAEHLFFLKIFVTNSLQVIDRPQQFRIQTQLAEQNLAPTPIALSECHQFWLEQWCESETLEESSESDSSVMIECLVNAMVAIHQCSVDTPALDLTAEWHRYLDVANENSDKYTDKIASLIKDYNREQSLCFCHNDLHYSHILSSNPLRIIDWEYAAIGNRYFDLAASIVANKLNQSQIKAFIDRYSLKSQLGNAIVTDGVKMMLPVVDFTNKLWQNAYNQITQF